MKKPELPISSLFKLITIAKKGLSLLLIIPILFISCKKNHPSDPTPDTNSTTTQKKPDIYVAGDMYNQSNQAVYWKNGVTQQVAPLGTSSTAYAIAIQGSDVYLAGYAIINGVGKAVYWKNGVATVLDNGDAVGIAVQGSDVYVAGYTNLGTAQYPYTAATYWKNGVATILPNAAAEVPNGPIDAFANAIAVQGSDVYVVGVGEVSYGGGDPIALYWKNGVATELVKYYSSDGLLNAQSHADAITLQGNDVYIAGGTTPNTGPSPVPDNYSGPIYWKNNTEAPLTGGLTSQSANSIAVNGSDIYVLAAGPTSNPVYWKNAVSIALKTNFSSTDGSYISFNPSGIAVNNSDVYVAGYSQVYNFQQQAINNVRAIYWKNGEIVGLPGSVARANAITVVVPQ